MGDIAKTAHKKCAASSKYSITRDMELQRQIKGAWSDADAHFHPDKIVRAADLRAMSNKIKDNDVSGRKTDFYQVYKECSKATDYKSYKGYLDTVSQPRK